MAISLDGSHFVSWILSEPIAVIQNSDSGAVVMKLQDPSSRELPDYLGGFHCCDFSPDGIFVAGIIESTIYIWDITNSEPCLVGTFVGCVDGDGVQSLAFSSCIISLGSLTAKFWQIIASSVGPVTADSESVPPTLAPITAINLQTNNGIALSGDSAGVVKSWDISTGICKESFYTPAKDLTYGDMQLINSRLILVWISDEDIYIWDAEKGELPQLICTPKGSFIRPRISGDGSMILLLGKKFIQAWSVRTGRVVSEAKIKGEPFCKFTIVDGSRIWAHFTDSQTLGWDFGISSSSPILLSDITPISPYPELYFKGWNIHPHRINNRVTGDEVFQLSGRYGDPVDIWWNGQHLIAGYKSGAVLVLDFDHILPQQRYEVSVQAHRSYTCINWWL